MKYIYYFFLVLYTIAVPSHALTLAQINKLIKKFGPLVKLHPQDISSPTSLDWYASRCSLKLRTGNSVKTIASKGKLTAAQLGQYDRKAAKASGGEYFLDPENNPETLRGQGYSNNLSPANCYVNVVERPSGIVALQFIFFYANQGALAGIKYTDTFFKTLDIGVHEGDWEHITIYLKKSTTDYTILEVFYSRHQQVKGELLYKKDIELVDERGNPSPTGTHPVVYAALNSHASYPHNITISKHFDRTSDTGPAWKCWEHAVYIGTEEHPASGQAWINFAGRWGATIETSAAGIEYHGNSPEGPAFAGSFLRHNVTKKHIELYIDGKEVDSIPFSLKSVESRKKSARYSPYFSLEVPARFRTLAWNIKQKTINHFSYEIWEKKTFTTDNKITPAMKSTKESITPKPDNPNNLYVANTAVPAHTKDTETYELVVYGVEE